jgi:hypothetical protein
LLRYWRPRSAPEAATAVNIATTLTPGY